MEIGGYGFEKPKLLKIAEDIYALKSKRQDLELTLSSEKFHYQYIPKRKDVVQSEVYSRLVLLIPLTILVISSLGYVLLSLADPGSVHGMSLLVAMFILVCGGYATIRLWIREIRMFSLLWISLKPEKSVAFFKKFDINTFQNDEENSRNRMEMLEAEIAHINQRIAQLETEQKQLLEQKKKEEDLLRENGVLFDRNPNISNTSGKFSLREESIGMGDAHALHEFYSKEEQYAKNCLLQLEGKLQRLDKQIVQIDDDFEQVKKILIFFVICYVLVILIQSAFSGLLGSFMAAICFVVSLVVCFLLEKKCSMPIILYLLEHDSSLVQEYAFRNNMVPVHLKREELLEKMQYVQKELDDLSKAKKELVFD